MIIGLVGNIGCGKDTAAEYLKTKGFKRVSFAGPLKDSVAAIFGWDRELLEGATPESRSWREEKDAWWSARLGREITPRWVLQYIGTEVMRDHFHSDIWTASLERHLEGDCVISDCRFPNELQTVKNLGGEIWRIYKGYIGMTGLHSSEFAWRNFTVDKTIDNLGTLEDLYRNLDNALGIA